MALPWQVPGDWLRCALHAHTTHSDGEVAPRTLVRHYGRAGFDVVALTDHWVRSEAPSTERVLVLPGAELNCVLPRERDGHVLALGIERGVEELEGTRLSLADAADWIAGAGGVSYLAHPYWTGVAPGEIELPPSMSGIEVFNAGCELEVGRGLSAVHWDELLEGGARCHGLVTDDSHHPGFDSGHAWTWVRAERSVAGVLEALRSGAFYGSTGPRIASVEVGERSIVVRCSAARSMTLGAGRQSGTAVHAGRLGYCHGGEILETSDEGWILAARLEAAESAPYARLELADPWGGHAWTNTLAP